MNISGDAWIKSFNCSPVDLITKVSGEIPKIERLLRDEKRMGVSK
jgi:hypothetical protein